MTYIDDRIAYLEILQVRNVAIDAILDGASRLSSLSPETIAFAAQSDPEMIQTAIRSLASIVGEQRQIINRMTEDYFALVDTVTSAPKE